MLAYKQRRRGRTCEVCLAMCGLSHRTAVAFCGLWRPPSAGWGIQAQAHRRERT